LIGRLGMVSGLWLIRPVRGLIVGSIWGIVLILILVGIMIDGCSIGSGIYISGIRIDCNKWSVSLLRKI
jgi:hypothetical protein